MWSQKKRTSTALAFSGCPWAARRRALELTQQYKGHLSGGTITLRLVCPDDANYIHALRTDERYNNYLNPASGSVGDQRAWIEDYKLREACSQEFYFLIERTSDSRPCGTVRLYQIDRNSFTWGSWILDSSRPKNAAIESSIISFGFGFEILGKKVANIDVRRENARALSFYRRMNMTQVRQDTENFYFNYLFGQFVDDKRTFIEALK